MGKIINGQIEAGDITGAQKTLASFQHMADQIPTPSPNASKMERSIPELIRIKVAHAKRRIEEALAGVVAPNTQDAARQVKSDTVRPIQLTKPIAVRNWLKILDDARPLSSYETYRCPLNTEPFLDLAGHLKSLPPSADPEKVFESLHETAKTIVDAHNVIIEMLKQEAKR